MYTLANVTPTICALMGLPFIENAENAPIQSVLDLANGKKIDKCLFFSPDAIGAWLFDKYSSVTTPLLSVATEKVELSSVMPSVTPVCYATMLSGFMPEAHGIRKYEKFPLTVDTLFHALVKGGKKCAIIAKQDSSCEMIFRNTPADIHIVSGDSQSHEKAKELIAQDEYDFILVYQCEYDDNMHKTQPETAFSLNAMEANVKSALELYQLAKEKWAGKNALVTFSPDHGIHTDPVTKLGTHGTDLDADLKIYHLFGVL